MKKEILISGALILVCAVGCLIGGFLGGILFGISIAILLFATVGRWQFKKSTARIDDFNPAIIKSKIKDDE